MDLANAEEVEYLRTIEWEMMNKVKFFPLSLLDAGSKIYKTEGLSGLYRGFWVSSVQIVSGVGYIGTYESTRHVLKQVLDNSWPIEGDDAEKEEHLKNLITKSAKSP